MSEDLKQIIINELNPNILAYRELWRAFKQKSGHPEKFSATLNAAIGCGDITKVQSHYAPYNKRKLCFLVDQKTHEKLTDEFGTNKYGKHLRFDRFSKIKRRRKLMRKHLVEEFARAARAMGLSVRQLNIKFIYDGAFVNERYWELGVPGAGRFVLAFRQFNCRPVTRCDIACQELLVARAIYAEGVACQETELVTADKIRPEDRYPEILPTTKPAQIVIVAPEVDSKYLRKHRVNALYINGPRYVPGFADLRSNYHKQVKTRRGLRIGLEFALRKFVFFVFKRRFPKAKNIYVIFRMKRCGIVFECSDVSLADFLPERLNRAGRDASTLRLKKNTRTTAANHSENQKPPPPAPPNLQQDSSRSPERMRSL